MAIVATVIGSVATHWINGSILVTATDVVVAALGLRFLFKPRSGDEVTEEVPHRVARTVAVAAVVGLAAGLLANSGGFLLAPLYLAVLRLPIKPAFGTSLIVSCVLAVPGTWCTRPSARSTGRWCWVRRGIGAAVGRRRPGGAAVGCGPPRTGLRRGARDARDQSAPPLTGRGAGQARWSVAFRWGRSGWPTAAIASS